MDFLKYVSLTKPTSKPAVILLYINITYTINIANSLFLDGVSRQRHPVSHSHEEDFLSCREKVGQHGCLNDKMNVKIIHSSPPQPFSFHPSYWYLY